MRQMRLEHLQSGRNRKCMRTSNMQTEIVVIHYILSKMVNMKTRLLPSQPFLTKVGLLFENAGPKLCFKGLIDLRSFTLLAESNKRKTSAYGKVIYNDLGIL